MDVRVPRAQEALERPRKNPGCRHPGSKTISLRRLHRLDFIRLHALLALDQQEADFLAFFQSLEAIALDRTEVHENITTAFRADETKTLGVVEPFHGTDLTIRHSYILERSM